MTKGGPVNATQTLVVEAYKLSFGSFNIGLGAAIAVVIFIILLLFTVLYRHLLMKQEKF
jgi:multiple sugar transport system permease protein